MKRYLRWLTIMVCLLNCHGAIAQLSDGTVAPDWSMTDINGVTYNLYDELNDGKSILLDISATWCSGCWNLHQSGLLEFYNDVYGPDGSDQLRVFWVEGDPDTNLACLEGTGGCNDATWGDWITNVDYPIFSPEPAEAQSFITMYDLGFWPTLYGISPMDKTILNLNPIPTSQWGDWLVNSFQMSAVATAVDADCGAPGSINLEINEGFGNLDFAWNNGSDDQNLTDIGAGIYSVTITDEHGISIEIEDIEVEGAIGESMAVSGNTFDVECFGTNDGRIEVQATGGSGSYVYNWDNGLVGRVIEDLGPGEYRVDINDDQGCTVFETYEIFSPTELQATVFENATSCAEDNGTVEFFMNGGSPPYTFDIGQGPSNDNEFSNLVADDYIAIIEDSEGCTVTRFFTIEGSDEPVANISGSSTLNCAVEEITLSAAGSTFDGNFSYSWSSFDGGIIGALDQETIQVNQAGTYAVTIITEISGCNSTETITITDNSNAPTVELSQPDVLSCSTVTTEIVASIENASSDLTYNWTTTNGTIESDSDIATIQVSDAGTYNLTVFNLINGCSTTTSTTVAEDIEEPTITVNNGEITCEVNTVMLCADIADGNTVSWITPSGVPLNNNSNCIEVFEPGQYTARVEASNGCTNSSTAEVSVSNDLPLVEIQVNGNITCIEPAVVVELISDEALTLINWFDGDNNIISNDDMSALIESAGPYMVEVTGINGCISTATFSVLSNVVLPDASFNVDAVSGLSVTLSSTSQGQGDLLWTFSDGVTDVGINTNYTFQEHGEYNICLTETNDCGEDTFCQLVSVNSLLSVTSNVTHVKCNGDSNGKIIPSVIGGQSGYTFQWTGPDNFTSSAEEIDQLSAGIYELNVIDEAGTLLDTFFQILEPEALVIMSDALGISCSDLSNGLINIDVTGGSEEYAYLWSDDVITANRQDLDAGEYVLVVTDTNGCSVTQSIEIEEPQALGVEDIMIGDDSDNSGNGWITISVEGGDGLYDYLWSNGEMEPTISNLTAGEYSVIVSDGNDCSLESGPYMVNSIVDVDDIDIVKEFNMYPIPASEYIKLDVTFTGMQDVELVIYDFAGVEQMKINKNTDHIRESIEVSRFAAGIYSLSLLVGDHLQTNKFIVVR